MSKERYFGQLIFKTADGKGAMVSVYRTESTFRLSRMPGGQQRSNNDLYQGNIEGYISEALMVWPDLVRDGATWELIR